MDITKRVWQGHKNTLNKKEIISSFLVSSLQIKRDERLGKDLDNSK